jgi:hypothetical protein
VSGTITVTADATDDVAVAGVRFLLDGAAAGNEDTAAPYTLLWNTTGVVNGVHQLAAIARDTSGNTITSATIPITVANAPPAGLVLALSFNEGTGTLANDTSGASNNGTLNGATWTTGKYGGGVSFAGAGTFVTVADSASLDLSTGMTISAWVNPSTLPAWPTVVLKERPSGLAYALYASAGATKAPSSYLDSAKGEYFATGTGALPLNAWTHLAATYDGAQVRLYVNGALVATKAASGNILATTGALRIGGNAVWGEYFAGVIDEIRIYNRALTQTAIQTDMLTPLQ